MPNHVTNVVRLQGDEDKIHEILEAIKNDEHGIGTIDFDKIIPMPESLNIEAGSKIYDALKAYQEFVSEYMSKHDIIQIDASAIPKVSEDAFLKDRKDIEEDEWNLGKQAYENQAKYGTPTWFEWRINCWDTKWNAYGFDDPQNRKTNEIRFNTAWSAPHTVLEKLSELYPKIQIEHSWADEDIGQNCGRRSYSEGERCEEYYPEGNIELIDFAAEILRCELSDYGLALNADESDYINIDNDDFDLIELLGKPALFTNGRLIDSDIPKGLHCYHLRESDTGEGFCSVETKVLVNHGGTVITDESLDFGTTGYISFTEETAPNFFNQKATMFQFLCGELDQTEYETPQIGTIKY